jgi:hypothetical protein
LCAVPLSVLSFLTMFSIGLLIVPIAVVAWLGAGAAHARLFLEEHR